MSTLVATAPGLPGLKVRGRKQVVVSQDSLVKTRFLNPGQSLPLVISPQMQGLDLIEWSAQNREYLEKNLMQYGGILFRGFDMNGPEDLERLIVAIAGQSLEYKERSSPRSQVNGNIYTSTDYPADQPIFLHNENSYQKTWPMKIFFYCDTPAEQGGETPIADCRKVYEQVDPDIREKFAEKKWAYVRNFQEGFGLPWETVFQTTDKARVNEYCQANGIEAHWKDDGHLVTRAVRPAISKHPKTGEMVWFNHATFFHVTTLEPEMRETLMDLFDEADLPTNTFYGDGSAIEAEVLDRLREIYHKETIAFPWQKDDVLMLDNMLVAHARSPFTGPRKVVVGMAEPCTWQQLV